MKQQNLRKAKKLSYIAIFCLILGSIGMDQITKIEAEDKLLIWSHPTNLKEYRGKSIPIWHAGEDFQKNDSFFLGFNFTYVRNQGAAWGVLSDWDDVYRVPFFYLVTLLAVIIILLYLRSTPLNHRLARFALSLIMSGALGNLCDRVRLGYVVDFLDFRWNIPFPFEISFAIDFLNLKINLDHWQYNFPNFNWADSCITTGVTLLIIDMLILEVLRKKNYLADKGLKSGRELSNLSEV